MKTYTIEIKVDTNDADYVSEVSTITEEDLEKIKPLIEAIQNFKPYTTPNDWSEKGTEHRANFPVGECCREDMGEKPANELYEEFTQEVFDIFYGLCPMVEYGFHDIESIRICEATPWVELLK